MDLMRRFYDPTIGRLTQVDPVTADQENYSTYQYSWNNPILRSDPNGDCPNCITAAIGAGIGVVVGGGIEAGMQLYKHGEINDWKAVGGAALQGGITGGAAGFTGGTSLLATMSVSAGANVVGGAVNRTIQGQTTTATDLAIDATVGGALGAASKVVGNIVKNSTNNLSNAAKGNLGEVVTEIKYGAQGYKSTGKAIVETGSKTPTGRVAVAKYDHAMVNWITGKKITVESKFNGSTLTPNQAAAQSRVGTSGGLITDRTTGQGLGNAANAAAVGTGSGVDAQRNKKP